MKNMIFDLSSYHNSEKKEIIVKFLSFFMIKIIAKHIIWLILMQAWFIQGLKQFCWISYSINLENFACFLTIYHVWIAESALTTVGERKRYNWTAHKIRWSNDETFISLDRFCNCNDNRIMVCHVTEKQQGDIDCRQFRPAVNVMSKIEDFSLGTATYRLLGGINSRGW